MKPTSQIETLESRLNDFDPSVRAASLNQLVSLAESGQVAISPEVQAVNMHCHTFFSFNGYGYSPSGLAWLAKRNGYRGMGIVDFDVLDGVDEFLSACETAGVRCSAGMETRVYLPQFAEREINSPGEPGVYYDMGIGFTSSEIPASVSHIAADLRQRALQRNVGMVARLNAYLAPLSVDYEKDILPLTPAGNVTERHMLQAYTRKARAGLPEPVAFWADKLGLPVEKVSVLIEDDAAFQNQVRAKLMKRGGVAYVQPGPATFPSVEDLHQFIVACGALPCAAWLDGFSRGEQDIFELLDLLVGEGVAALNVVPDRNWYVADPVKRQASLDKLYQIVELTHSLDLPLNVGTEMNSFGQRLIDDFEVAGLQPVRQAFLDGASFIYGHTVLQRALGLGYQSVWARQHLPARRERNAFYTAAGRLVQPGKSGLTRLKAIPLPAEPAQILAWLGQIK